MRRWWFGIATALLTFAGCAAPADRDVLYQTSTINALLEGLYDGHVALAELLRHGDFGIGTFDALDGEMLVLDGCVYQVRADGRVYRPGPEAATPFATVTFFDADRTLTLDGTLDLAELEALLDQAAPARNVPVAVRITGTFAQVKTRSVPRQSRPYPRLVDVTARQPTFEFKGVAGTIVGFRLPEFFKGLNVTGWHLHFLTSDRTGGGHVLEVETEKARADLDETPSVFIALPRGGEFGKADLSKDRDAEVRRVEK
jgi:acetolactate decarboxylase